MRLIPISCCRPHRLNRYMQAWRLNLNFNYHAHAEEWFRIYVGDDDVSAITLDSPCAY
jgi:hypothetical protein